MSPKKAIAGLVVLSAISLSCALGYSEYTRANYDPINKVVGMQFTDEGAASDVRQRAGLPTHYVVEACKGGVRHIVDPRSKSWREYECSGNVRVYDRSGTFLGKGTVRYLAVGTDRGQYTMTYRYYKVAFDEGSELKARLP